MSQWKVKNSEKEPVRTSSTRRAGFTLVELLIVMAIIALLAAILFPVFSRVRENARSKRCASNLKQMGLALRQYSQDYDSRFVISHSTLSTNPGPYGWADALQPYLKNEQIYQCPSDRTPPPSLTNANRAQQNGYTDYFYNMAMSRALGGSTKIGVHETQVEYPALTICFGDISNTKTVSTNANVTDRGGGGSGFASSTNPGWVKHLDGGNFVFVDGHVKWYKGRPGSTASPKIYRVHHPFASGLAAFGNVEGSGNSPTLHVSDAMTVQPTA